MAKVRVWGRVERGEALPGWLDGAAASACNGVSHRGNGGTWRAQMAPGRSGISSMMHLNTYTQLCTPRFAKAKI